MAGIKEVADQLSDEFSITKTTAEEAVKSVLENIVNLVKAGESVIFKGFGTFKLQEYAARTCRNPSTGEQMSVPAKTKMVFKSKV